ncbi:GNAT family N-acetyltransferase [Candidatus Poribacteria bacterium]|jgi:GNAT superfamily N-acetyltransferase|nr:GNAT family N-acetyltransferase [Candidatus Poribacteria bacterium]MBT5534104.1 GNAT family N-acetyltransferase [Candidatus Poribacteria bacterium]MBT5711307.1 GNAT family N-acetyltransferase [Candidatus Poribacteria bacterium]MBT7099657.1 GNAT family N-acetyltransferase [Candidatus Poribacteria bacterium]MBT7809610.1 GNAT family N-acetyltransferase [Candidatus Poribacteria bacterium]
MTSGLKIRYSGAKDSADKPIVHDIAVAAWTPIMERYRLIVGDDLWGAVWKGWEDNWLKNVNGYVTEMDGQIVGFATYLESREGVAEIGANAVHPDHQGLGIGTAQMRHLVGVFRQRGYRCAWVHTGADPAHGPARAEYRKIGLRKSLASAGYYGRLREAPTLRPPEGVTYRWATPDDSQRVREIACEAWEPLYHAVEDTLGDEICALTHPGATDRRAGEWAEATADGSPVLLAESGGRPVGFACLDADESRKLGKLRTVAVTPGSQGGGVGSGLCMEVFHMFRERGLEYVVLWANQGEVSPETRRLCWRVGMYHEVLSTNYYMML